MDLDAIIPLKKAGEYSNPEAPEAIIPDVYGGWLSTDVGDPTSVDVATPAVRIDNASWTYAVNARQTSPATPAVFYNGVLQQNPPAAPVWVWNPANNFQGHGLIATLRFLVDVTKGVISVRHGGSVDASGAPITNPVFMLVQFLQDRAGWTLADFDRALCQQTAFDMDLLGYPAYGCFQEELTAREWLRQLMPQYHTDFTETGQGQLAMILDRSLTTLPIQPDYHVPAYEIEDFGSPAQAIRIEAHLEDVVNEITIRGRYNWAIGDYSAAYGWGYAQSQSAYNAALPATFSWRNMYTPAHAAQWLSSHGVRHGFEPRTVTFTLKTLRGLALIPPRFITVEWPRRGWVQRLLKVKRVTVRWAQWRTELECVDCWRELSVTGQPPTASPTLRRMAITPNYQWIPGTVGDNGQLIDAPTNTRNEASNGDFELGPNGQWDTTGGGAAEQWVITANASEAYSGTWYALHQTLMGDGIMQTLRHRVDPGQSVLVSAWFRRHSGSTTGQARTVISYYNQAGALMAESYGNAIDPSDTYRESVAYGQAPALAYYYRPGVGFANIPSTGQWRCDQVFAASGSEYEVLTARQGSVVSRNFVVNGDFENAGILWSFSHPTWFVTNTGDYARSGVWYAAHGPSASGIEERLNSQTRIAVTPGQTFTFQAHTRTLNDPNGQGRLGVTWIDGQGNSLGENATAYASGPFVSWTLASGSMTVPSGSAYAHTWIGILGHTGPAQSYFLIDDCFVYS